MSQKLDAAAKRERFHHGDLRSHVLRLARVHIETRDSASLSLRALAASAGVNHRALYRHFVDREALIHSVAALGFEELVDVCTESIEHVDNDRALNTLLIAYAQYAFGHIRLYKLMFSLPLNREFKLDSEISNHLRALVKLAQLHTPAEGRTGREVRDEIVRSWAVVHGLIDLFHSGVLESASATKALEYIGDSLKRIKGSATPTAAQLKAS